MARVSPRYFTFSSMQGRLRKGICPRNGIGCVKDSIPRDAGGWMGSWKASMAAAQDLGLRGARLRAEGGGIWLSMRSRSASRKRRSFSTEGRATR
jgi:hypothetical protein